MFVGHGAPAQQAGHANAFFLHPLGLPDDVEAQTAQCREVLLGVPLAHPRSVFAKVDIEHPVVLVLDAPVRPLAPGEGLRVWCTTGNGIAFLKGWLAALLGAPGFNPHDAAQSFPVLTCHFAG